MANMGEIVAQKILDVGPEHLDIIDLLFREIISAEEFTDIQAAYLLLNVFSIFHIIDYNANIGRTWN